MRRSQVQADIETRPSSPLPHTAGAWWVWMGAQLCVLALFAGRVPMAARFPGAVENSAGVGVGVAQIVGAILLAPLIAATYRDAAVAIAGGGPVLLAATLLAGAPAAEAALPIGLLAIWLIALVIVHRSHILRAALAMLAIAGPVVWYAVGESGRPISLTPRPAALSPSLSAAAISFHLGSGWMLFLPPLILVAGNLAKNMVFQRIRPGAIAEII